MIEIQKLEFVRKGALVAKFNCKFHKWGGLIIRECCLFESGDKRWITLPSRQYELEGKKKYFEFLCYEDRNINDALKKAIMAAADEFIAKSMDIKDVEAVTEDVPF